MIRTLTMREVLERAIDAKTQSLRVALPARVERYDAAKQWVDVKPLLQDWYVDEDGARKTVSVPVISQVPVVFPGAGGFRLTFPVQAGDTVLLVFADRSIDKWLDSAGSETDPTDMRMHHLSDAIAIPGLHSFESSWTGASTSNATLGKDGGPQIALTPSTIELGGNTDAVALASKVLARLEAFVTTFNSHTHIVAGVVGVGGAVTGTAAVTTSQMLSPATVASSTVKAKD